jgi:hypothetical protein
MSTEFLRNFVVPTTVSLCLLSLLHAPLMTQETDCVAVQVGDSLAMLSQLRVEWTSPGSDKQLIDLVKRYSDDEFWIQYARRLQLRFTDRQFEEFFRLENLAGLTQAEGERARLFKILAVNVSKMSAPLLSVSEKSRQTSGPPIRGDEIRQYHNALEVVYSAEPRQDTGEKLHLRQIFVTSKGQTRREAQTTVNEIYHAVVGETARFETIVKPEPGSSGPPTYKDIGFFFLEDLANPVAAVVSQLSQGEVSSPIEQQDGFLLFKVVARQPERFASIDSGKAKIAARLERLRSEIPLLSKQYGIEADADVPCLSRLYRRAGLLASSLPKAPKPAPTPLKPASPKQPVRSTPNAVLPQATK